MHGATIKLDRPVSASSNCPFKGLPSRLRPTALQFSIIFVILPLSVLVACSLLRKAKAINLVLLPSTKYVILKTRKTAVLSREGTLLYREFWAKFGGKSKAWVIEFRDTRQGVRQHRAVFHCIYFTERGHPVAQLVEALRYKPEGSGFDSRWCHWNFSFQ